MRNYLVILFIAILIQNTAAQISSVKLNEEFLDNRNHWYLFNTPEGTVKIENGRYIMTGKMLGKAITSTIPINSQLTEDFKISTEITKIEGIDDNGFGLVWGASDPNNEFEFVISGNGQFKVVKWENGKSTDLIPWTSHSGINRWDNSTNRLRIEKRGPITKFYINDYYVSRISNQEIFGNKTGFVINETMKISINYLVYEKITGKYVIEDVQGKVSIQLAEFNGSNELRYQESAVLKVIVANSADHSVYDLALMISSFDDANIDYNRISMIEKIPANDRIILSIVFTADENIQEGNRSFELNLVDSKNTILDSKTINLKTIQNQFYQVYSEDNNVQNNPINKQNPTATNTADGCTKGCAYISFAALIAGIILAIL